MRLAFLVVAASLGAPAISWAAERPAPLPDEDNCRHYRGTSSGNDPSVRLDVVLCPHPDGGAGRVAGKVQWSSLLSGWNLRGVEGSWSGGTLTMRDLEIIEEKPASGFRFCTIDRYALEEDASGALKGSYRSAACSDNASVTLEPVVTDARDAEGKPSVTPKPAPKPAPPKTTPPEPEERTAATPGKGGCGCDVSLVAMLPLAAGGRRRSRTRVRI
ncbi:MAG: hypothetical protein AAF721_25455 [Myxococcota bacterium]